MNVLYFSQLLVSVFLFIVNKFRTINPWYLPSRHFVSTTEDPWIQHSHLSVYLLVNWYYIHETFSIHVSWYHHVFFRVYKFTIRTLQSFYKTISVWNSDSTQNFHPQSVRFFPLFRNIRVLFLTYLRVDTFYRGCSSSQHR